MRKSVPASYRILLQSSKVSKVTLEVPDEASDEEKSDKDDELYVKLYSYDTLLIHDLPQNKCAK